jgi:hypothetical protein
MEATIEALKTVFKNTPSQSNAPTKAKYLLAFRTIIKMLSLIQSGRSSAEMGPIATGERDCNELRVLDALSAVLVREHEITAVVARPYDGSTIQVFASVVHPRKAEFLLQDGANSDERSLWDRIRNFAIAMNPRVHPINERTDSLMKGGINSPFEAYDDKVPEDLVRAAKQNASVLDIFLKSHW